VTAVKRISPIFLGLALLVAVGEAEGRVRSKEISLEYLPSDQEIATQASIKACILPIRNDRDLLKGLQDAESALRGLHGTQYNRVVGVRYDTRQKPVHRFMTQQPIERILGEALEYEFASLGLAIVAPPVEQVPAELTGAAMLNLMERWPSEAAPDIIIYGTVKAFHFALRPELVRRYGSLTPYEKRTRMKISCTLYIAVFDTGAEKFLWSGIIKAGDAEENGIVKGKAGARTRINLAFHNLVEGVLRTNAELKHRLQSIAAAPESGDE